MKFAPSTEQERNGRFRGLLPWSSWLSNWAMPTPDRWRSITATCARQLGPTPCGEWHRNKGSSTVGMWRPWTSWPQMVPNNGGFAERPLPGPLSGRWHAVRKRSLRYAGDAGGTIRGGMEGAHACGGRAVRSVQFLYGPCMPSDARSLSTSGILGQESRWGESEEASPSRCSAGRRDLLEPGRPGGQASSGASRRIREGTSQAKETPLSPIGRPASPYGRNR